MRVRVYRNLHKDCFSVQRYIPGIGWRLWKHARKLNLKDVVFKVSQAGRERVVREHRKNVHAVIEGDTTRSNLHKKLCSPIMYNPYKFKSFVDMQTERPLSEVNLVTFDYPWVVYR